MFSILILTKDEEANLPDCLASVGWCDDVVVLDSFSTDRTCELASASGARLFQRKFDNFGAQRNYALDGIAFKHPWVFHLDADERFNEALREECERVIAKDECSAYFVPNRIIFLGKWIRRSTQYPYPQVRLLKIGEARFERSGHGQREAGAKRGVGHIRIPYDHFNFSKGISDWVEKHNRYASEEAADMAEILNGGIDWSGLFSTDGMRRRRTLKRMNARLPGRYFVKFFYLFLFSRGFLDGYPGFAYCMLQSYYDFLISVKYREATLRRQKG